MRRSTATRARQDASTLFDPARLHHLAAQATPAERLEGIDWYATAHEHAQAFAIGHDITPRQAAGIIAALSPQNGWDNNLQAVERFLTSNGEDEVHFHLCTERARAILRTPGADPLTILGGPKVRSFYRNIADPSTPGPVTIDRHAVAALAGLPTPAFLRTHAKFLDRRGIYGIASAYYRHAAREHDLAPHELQAVVWLQQRKSDAPLPTF